MAFRNAEMSVDDAGRVVRRWLREFLLESLRPAELEIGNEPLDEVDITLEGGKSRLEEINARNLVARVDISQLRPGERILRLSRENVSMDLPEGVRVSRIEPQSVALKVERSVERELEVE